MKVKIMLEIAQPIENANEEKPFYSLLEVRKL